jgi:hypothetical protein
VVLRGAGVEETVGVGEALRAGVVRHAEPAKPARRSPIRIDRPIDSPQLAFSTPEIRVQPFQPMRRGVKFANLYWK